VVGYLERRRKLRQSKEVEGIRHELNRKRHCRGYGRLFRAVVR
jgi:hypothetical protein